MRVENKNTVLKCLETGNGQELREQIVFSVMPKDNAKELLERIPYREYLDFIVYYKLRSFDNEIGEKYIIIDNEIAEKMCAAEPELYRMGMENTERQLGLYICKAADIAPEVKEFLKEPLWVVTSKTLVNGAAFIMLSDVLRHISDNLNRDVVILISTTEELFVAKADEMVAMKLRDAAMDFKEYVDIDKDERMTGSVYIYNRNTGAVELYFEPEK